VGVIITIDGSPSPCMTRNLSKGGLFALTKRKAAPGAVVGLEVVHKGTRLKARAKVVQQTEQGLGLSFVDVDDGFRSAIRALMDRLVADQASASIADFDDVEEVSELTMSWGYPGQGRGWKFWRKGRYDVTVVNLSLDGASFAGEDRPSVGDTVVVNLEGLKDTRGKTLSCPAQVVRHTDGGFAVKFVSPSIDFRQAISAARRSKFTRG
jgi:hypothetical protein